VVRSAQVVRVVRSTLEALADPRSLAERSSWLLGPQLFLVLLSGASLAVLIGFLIHVAFAFAGDPEGIQKIWHELGLRCVPQSVPLSGS